LMRVRFRILFFTLLWIRFQLSASKMMRSIFEAKQSLHDDLKNCAPT
jgi:hypothetical protein